VGKRLSRNAPCPCGSGKKYKHCCIGKDFDWIEMPDGNVGRRMQVSPEMAEALEDIKAIQLERFGYLPEKIFEGAPPLEHLEHWTVEAMKKGGVEPALIYAFEKTDGLLLNTRNENKCPDTDIAAWEAAIDEYELMTGKKAARRRLTDQDREAILQNGPKDHSKPRFVTRMPVPPPFNKDEWGKRHMSDIVDDPEMMQYLRDCIVEIHESGRSETYLNMFQMMTQLGGPSSGRTDYAEVLKEAQGRSFSVPEMKHALESLALTCEPKSAMPCAAAAFEFLAFIDDFMRCYTEHNGKKDELMDVLQRVNGLSLLAFVAAVNAELGVQPDIWRR
jgi:hypothetical protein